MLLVVIALIITAISPAGAYAASYMLSYVNHEDADYIPAWYYDPTSRELPQAFRSYNSGHRNLCGFWYISVSSYRDTPCYCIDILNDRTQGGVDWYSTSTPPRALDQQQRNLLAYVLSHGYTAGWRQSGTDFSFQVATQIAVWLITTGDYSDPTSVDAVCRLFAPSESIGAKAKQLLEDALSAFTIPSFASFTEDTSEEYRMIWDSDLQTYTLTLTDTNDVLDNWDFESIEEVGITITRSGNELCISGYPSNGSVTFKDYITTGNLKMARLLYLTYNSYQSLTYSTAFANEPVTAVFRIKAEKPSISIRKTSDDGIVKDMSFEITRDGSDDPEPVIITTDENGLAGPVELFPGRYTVKEINVDERYVAPEPITVELTDNEEVELSFENKTRKLVLSKESEDGFVEGIGFNVSCEELGYDTMIYTDENGKWTLDGLLPGIYTIEETEYPERFVKADTVTVEVTYDQDMYTVTCVNRLIKGRLGLTKISTFDGKQLSGAVYSLYDSSDNYICSLTTDSYSAVYTPLLEYGDYYLVETEAPKGHILNTKRYSFSIVDDGKDIPVTLTDDPMIGKVIISWNDHFSNVDTSDGVNYSILYLSLIYLSLILLLTGVKLTKVRR